MKNDFSKIMMVCLLATATIFTYKNKTKITAAPEPKVSIISHEKSTPPPSEKPIIKPKTPEISVVMPAHLSYNQTVEQLKKWHAEAPELTDIATYGKTRQGIDLYYIKVSNKLAEAPTSKVLITSAIHGNESLSSSMTLAYIGMILSKYGQDPSITELVDSRELYFVPVVSPDSYPITRYVDGVDPNRDFPGSHAPFHQSTPTVAALQSLFWKIRPCAVISGHTFGRMLLTPFGDARGINFHQQDYDRIVGEMAKMTNYKMIHASELYSRPITGSEVDYFYRNGSMALVIEYGTHQHRPTIKEIASEFIKVKDAITLFVKEAPKCKVKAIGEEIDFSRNTGIARKYLRLPNGELTPASPY